MTGPTFTVKKLRDAVQAKLPPGFAVYDAKFERGAYSVFFTYCDRHKYMMYTPTEHDTFESIVTDMADAIEALPMSEWPAVETMQCVIRLAKKRLTSSSQKVG